MIKFFHNPRCSKSRQGLTLLEEKGAELRVIKYLDSGIDENDVDFILSHFKGEVRELIRTKEPLFKESGIKADELDKENVKTLLLKTPKLLERPLAIKGKTVLIGRPPENFSAL